MATTTTKKKERQEVKLLTPMDLSRELGVPSATVRKLLRRRYGTIKAQGTVENNKWEFTPEKAKEVVAVLKQDIEEEAKAKANKAAEAAKAREEAKVEDGTEDEDGDGDEE